MVLLVMRGYSLYSKDVAVVFEGLPLPMGMTTPSAVILCSLGSGAVLPTPLVLCFPGGSLVTNSA